jgi:hypothetical protein
MTRPQIERAYRQLIWRLTRYDGYQPWGTDLPTLRVRFPGFWPAVERLREEWKRAATLEQKEIV